MVYSTLESNCAANVHHFFPRGFIRTRKSGGRIKPEATLGAQGTPMPQLPLQLEKSMGHATQLPRKQRFRTFFGVAGLIISDDAQFLTMRLFIGGGPQHKKQNV